MRALRPPTPNSELTSFPDSVLDRRRIRAALTRRIDERVETYHRNAARLRGRGDFVAATQFELQAVRLRTLTRADKGD